MVYDWDAHQQTCYRLYIEEGRPLEEIMEHMKHAHRFAPSKRAFQTQFRRWNFPSKQHPAHKNERLVARIRELWEKNFAQRDMLRKLNEDGFDINSRELMRVRTRNSWLLRAPNGDRATGMKPTDKDPPLDSAHPSLDEDATLSGRDVRHLSPGKPSSKGRQASGHLKDNPRKGGKGKRGRKTSADPSITTRFPSETTLDEARRILDLDLATYRLLRTAFQRICYEESVFKKTIAGVDRWEAVKMRLIRGIPLLETAMSMSKDNLEAKKLALDVICTDVTKRMRTLEARMTLAEAKNLLGVNPDEARSMRVAFHQVLSESTFTCKSEVSPEQWEDLKCRWGQRSHLVRRITDGSTSGEDLQKKTRALEVMARDVMKRIRDAKGRRSKSNHQQLPLSPAVSSPGGPSPNGGKTDHQSRDSLVAELGDGMASNAFDDVSDASQMAFSPARSTMGARLRMSASNLSDSHDALTQPPMPAGMGLESQMEPSLLLGANGQQAAFMDQPYEQPQYAGPATPAEGFPQAQQEPPASTAFAVYLRLNPSSSLVANASLWIATLGSPSVEELRRAAVEKIPGTTFVRVEGVLKDAKGRELPLQIEQDEELSAYLAHLQGAAPTFSVQLAWKAP